MQDKELEKILQEKADKEKKRDFSEVWNEIKGEVVPEKTKKKLSFKKWLPMALASACLVVALVISPIIINAIKPPPEEVYFADGLIMQNVLEEEMIDGLSQASISHVNLKRYAMDSCKLFLTENNKVKGASFRAYSDIPTLFFADLTIYDKKVDLKLNLVETYGNIYEINSTDVHYKFKQASGGMYEYSVYALHNGVQYVIEYTDFSDNLMEFLMEFFA